MLRGWFDAFRSEGGPTLYSLPNRTPVTEDVRNVIVYVSFATIFIAFLIVFPGIRKEKLSTFISVTISLFVGAVILIANYGSEWHVARATVSSPYRAFSREKISADVGVKVGLNSVNITLREPVMRNVMALQKVLEVSCNSVSDAVCNVNYISNYGASRCILFGAAADIHQRSEDINYNERFRWIGANEMKQEYRAALVKGLPFPLLTIAEYFTQELEGFCWGRRYRLAGYYSHILLWSAFALWLLMNILLCTVPRYGAYTMQLTGVMMLLANAVYAHLLPRRPLVIPFEGGSLHFRFGWCFWLLLAAGVSAIVVGGAVAIVDVLFPHKFATILEVDYGMPYRSYDEKRPCSQTNSLPSSDGGCFENGAYEGDDGYATVINGKRAVSLRNFEKFCQRERLAMHCANRNIHAFTTADYKPSSSKDLNIDLSAAALW